MKKFFNSKAFDIVAMVGILLAYLYLTVAVADTDAFFIVSQGRDIISGGIPDTLLRFTYFPIDTVIQNYGWCVIVAFMYDWLGNVGLAILQGSIVICIAFSGAYLMKLKGSDKSFTRRMLIVMVLTSAALINIRPQLITLLLLILEVVVIEKCIATDNYKYAFLIMPLVLIEMQVHMAMWFMHFVVALPYIFPVTFGFVPLTMEYKYKKRKTISFGFKEKDNAGDEISESKSGTEVYEIDGGYETLKQANFNKTDTVIKTSRYSVKPTKKSNYLIALCVGILSFGCLFLNPYGAKGVTYFFESVGYVSKFNISECAPAQFIYHAGLVLIFSIVMYVRKIEKCSTSDNYMITGILFMTMVAVRNCSLIPIILIILFSKYKKGEESELVIIFTAFLVALSFIKMDFVPLSNELKNSYYDDLDNILQYVPDKHSKIYTTGYADGNYMGYLGYDIFFDARPEIFSDKVNHVRDIGQDFLDIRRYNDNAQELIQKYDFEYFIVEKDSRLYIYLDCSDEYCTLESSNELTLFSKKSFN